MQMSFVRSSLDGSTCPLPRARVSPPRRDQAGRPLSTGGVFGGVAAVAADVAELRRSVCTLRVGVACADWARARNLTHRRVAMAQLERSSGGSNALLVGRSQGVARVESR